MVLGRTDSQIAQCRRMRSLISRQKYDETSDAVGEEDGTITENIRQLLDRSVAGLSGEVEWRRLDEHKSQTI